MKRAVIYARISQDRAGDGAGVGRQEADARALAETRGWQVVDTVVDNDISAAGKKRRPGFERTLSLVASGGAEVVVAWALDRLTRNRPDTVRLIETCQQRGATIALVRGSDLDMGTPAGRLTADLLAAVARSEIEAKADRHQRAAQQSAEAGRWHGGNRPFGFRADGKTVFEEEACAVRDGYQWILDGVGHAEVARRWNARGITTPGGRTWDGRSVSRSLVKARNAGLRVHRGEVVGPAEWPALVDQETWYAAVAALRDPTRKHRRADKRLLSGIMTCGVCGAPLQAGSNNGNLNYRCSAVYGHVARKSEPLEDFVQSVVVERLSRRDARGVFARPSDDGRPHLSELLRELDELRQRLDGLSEAYADGTINLSQLRKGSERIKARISEAEARITTTNPTAHQLYALVNADDVLSRWRGLSRDVQRDVIAYLLPTLSLQPVGRGKGRTLDPVSVEIAWRVAP